MNIIICGAGRVGFTIAKLLSEQNHSITVIDQSSEDIQKINDSLDVKGIVGKATYPSILEKADIHVIRHPIIKSALSISKPINLNNIKEVKFFPYETQDLSSQSISLICNPKSNETWFDACAGSGGKTLHLAQLLKKKGKVIAYDIRKNMLKKIKNRSKKWGLKNIIIFENQDRIFQFFPNGHEDPPFFFEYQLLSLCNL